MMQPASVPPILRPNSPTSDPLPHLLGGGGARAGAHLNSQRRGGSRTSRGAAEHLRPRAVVEQGSEQQVRRGTSLRDVRMSPWSCLLPMRACTACGTRRLAHAIGVSVNNVMDDFLVERGHGVKYIIGGYDI
eukprot:167223-Prymnesium_polylepis.1